MRKKLDTRFPAARIKKIMQADEDVGKIAMAVPVLVSKALELFLQDLCDRTHEVTLKKEAKTINSLHLKECVHSFSVFDFLQETVSNIPELGHSDAVSEDRSETKKRKISEDEKYGYGEGFKKDKSASTNNSGRGRDRGRGRGRSSRTIQGESIASYMKFEGNPNIINPNDENLNDHLVKSSDVIGDTDSRTICGKDAEKSAIDFDLNVDLNEIGDTPLNSAEATPASSKKPPLDTKHEDIPGWSLDDMERMAINPAQLAHLSRGADEEDEDYDEDGSVATSFNLFIVG